MPSNGHEAAPIAGRVHSGKGGENAPNAGGTADPVWCGCGDGIVANDGAKCGTCVYVDSLSAEDVARDAARYRWLRAQHDPRDLPIAQVVWKRGSDPRGEWVNLINGTDLDRHIDAQLDPVRVEDQRAS